MQGRVKDRDREIISMRKEFEDFRGKCICMRTYENQMFNSGSSSNINKKAMESLGENVS
jgi:hypothetical protein